MGLASRVVLGAILIPFISSTLWAPALSFRSPLFLLQSSNTWTAWQVFESSATFEGSVIFSSDVTMGTLVVDSSMTVRGVFISTSSALLAGATIQNNLIVEGRIAIGTSTPTSFLDIVDGSITVRGINSDIIATTITARGQFIVGSSPTITTGGVGLIYPRVMISNEFNIADGFSKITDFAISKYSGSGFAGVNFNFARYRGTQLNPTVVQNGDEIVALGAAAWDGDNIEGIGGYYFVMDGAVGSNDVPSRAEIKTVPDGSNVVAIRLTVKEDGKIGVGTGIPSSKFDVFDGSFTSRGTNAGVHTTGGVKIDVDLAVATNTPHSTLHSVGSLSLGGYRLVVADTTLNGTDYFVECATHTFTVTLPTAVGITGRGYEIKSNSTGTITLNTTGTQLIDDSASGTLTLAQFENLVVKSNGFHWLIR